MSSQNHTIMNLGRTSVAVILFLTLFQRCRVESRTDVKQYLDRGFNNLEFHHERIIPLSILF